MVCLDLLECGGASFWDAVVMLRYLVFDAKRLLVYV